MIGFISSTAHEVAVAKLQGEIDRLREQFELRLRAHERLVDSIVAECVARAREAVEGRIQLATGESKAFAQQGLELHDAALRAIGRRLSELSADESPRANSPFAGPSDASGYVLGVASTESRDCRRIELPEASEATFAADLANLPIRRGGAAKLVAAHVVEFVPPAALKENILPHWRSRLAPGGELIVVTLDGPAWSADLARNGNDFVSLRQRLGGDGSRRPPRWLFDATGLGETLSQAGFQPEVPTTAPPFELRVVARAAAG